MGENDGKEAQRPHKETFSYVTKLKYNRLSSSNTPEMNFYCSALLRIPVTENIKGFMVRTQEIVSQRLAECSLARVRMENCVGDYVAGIQIVFY